MGYTYRVEEQVMRRFLAKIDRRGADECWLWTASSSNGYGQYIIDGKNHRTHRLAYELWVGPIPEGEGYHGVCVCHRCDNPLCCNPAHLFLGSNSDNVADMWEKRRSGGFAAENARKTHCKRGHEFTEKSSYVNPKGSRVCRLCDNLRRKVINPKPHPNAAKTHCKHGHEFTDENTYVDPVGRRQCRTCRRAGARKRHG